VLNISLDSAYEIVTHPGDLHICICKEDNEDPEDQQERYSLMILHGPGRSFNPIVTTEPQAGTRRQAVKAVRGILEEVRAAVFASIESGSGQVVNRLNLTQSGVDLGLLLSKKNIGSIAYWLRSRDSVHTYSIRRKMDWQNLSHQVH
jgi:hypothetical protein